MVSSEPALKTAANLVMTLLDIKKRLEDSVSVVRKEARAGVSSITTGDLKNLENAINGAQKVLMGTILLNMFVY